MFRPEYDADLDRIADIHRDNERRKIMHHPELRLELEDTLRRINTQIEEIEGMARRQGCEPYLLMDRFGHHFMTPLLAAKAQTLAALAHIG